MAVAQQPRTLIETSTAGWYIDPNSGKKVRKRQVDKTISQSEYESILGTGPKDVKIYVSDTGKALFGPTTTISCVDCGASRVVKVQDAHQVTRCAQHQREHRNALRREKRAKARADANADS